MPRRFLEPSGHQLMASRQSGGKRRHLASVLTAGPELVEASSRLSMEQLAELQRLEPALQLVDVRSPAPALSTARRRSRR